MGKLKSMFRPKLDGTLMRKDIQMELFKFFKVIKVIGRGSYSTVYKVQRLSDGKFYALKQTDVASLNARERKDMVNEIRLLASLEHPNLLQCFEAFCDHHQLCIVTDLATGDLGSLIDKRSDEQSLLSERTVWSYFLQIALALQYLHHNHVLHRDLKPQNILISSSGLLKIADLGISQVLDHVFTRALIGTPYYMSPEMWKRDPYSYSADVWALGCILYELCALKPLFMAREEKDIKRKVLSGLLDPLPKRYSMDLYDVMRLMLTPDPAERPTIDEILQLPAVQAHMDLVPEEDRPLLPCNRQHHDDDHVQLLQPIQVPRMSADWEHINVFLPPAKYSVGPGVVDALRMKVSTSCPDLCGPGGGGAAAAAGGEGAAGGGGSSTPDGGGGLCGPSSLRVGFGETTAQWVTRRGATDPAEVGGGALRKVPSDGSLRGGLQRSHTVAVGEVVFTTHRGQRRGGGSNGVGGRASGDGGSSSGGSTGKPRRSVELDAKEVAALVAEAWGRARNRGEGAAGGRRSITIAQVLLNHTAADDFVGTHDRHEQEKQAMVARMERFTPVPVEFCPALPTQRRQQQQQTAAARLAAAPAAAAASPKQASPGQQAPPALNGSPKQPAAPAAAAQALPGGVGAAVQVVRGSGSPSAGAGGSSLGSGLPPPGGAAAEVAVQPGAARRVSWKDEAETPVVKREKAKLFSFLRKLGRKSQQGHA